MAAIRRSVKFSPTFRNSGIFVHPLRTWISGTEAAREGERPDSKMT